jgi:cytochrome bd-type quinol oxidase subunit 2
MADWCKAILKVSSIISPALLGLAAAIILLGGWMSLGEAIALTGFALLPPFFFVALERYIFFLSVALTVVMYALVNVSRSEI